jgi:hypothetical protein
MSVTGQTNYDSAG